jgi:NADPH:quinone reductase-like Zn-dependent oxidoreductase
LAVQLAKARGAYVIGTARSGKHDFVRSLDADEVIDYTAVDPADVLDEVDIVLDPVGGPLGDRLISLIRHGGMLLPFAAEEPTLATAASRGVRVREVPVEPDGHALDELARLVEAGKLGVPVVRAWPIEAVAEAHRHGERGRTAGKLVLTVVP